MKNICNLWRIGLSEAALAKNYFKFFKIPVPTTFQFVDHSGTFSQSDGGLVQHGFYNMTFTWEALMPHQLRRIKAFVDGSLGGVGSGTGFLYLTVPYNNGAKIGVTWIDTKSVPHPMNPQVGGTFTGGGTGMYYENVQLFANAVEILQDPAIF